jgi:hypothetical protein
MAKYASYVGIAVQQETSPGIWERIIVDHPVFGDEIRNNVNFQGTEEVSDKIKINNQISIIIDPFLKENFSSIVYVTYWGAKWKITTSEIVYPRAKLSFGEVYNG